MNFKQIIGLSFGGVAAVGGIVASGLYLPQVVQSNEFFGTQLVDNQQVYRSLKTNQPVSVFANSEAGNLAHFVGGTPNVSLDVLLNGTNQYASGNYIVLFASDGDALSNQFLYDNMYTLKDGVGNRNINFNKFGFDLTADNKIVFDAHKVEASYQAGSIQTSFQYVTSSKALNIMADLPSIVLVHDKLNYDAMQSLVDYKEYVVSCLHDVVVNQDGTYTFKVGSPFYKDYLKQNEGSSKNLGTKDDKGDWNFKVATSLTLFQNLLGYQDNLKPEDQTDANTKLGEQAETLNKEYNWANERKNNDGQFYGFDFNPLNSSLEANTYEAPDGTTKLYRNDIGAKKYVESFTLFKNKLNPTYVDNGFASSKGHYIGFAHSSIKNESVVLGSELSSVPSNASDNLDGFAGEAANTKFAASMVSLYNSISNGGFKGLDLQRFITSSSKSVQARQWTLATDKKTALLRQYYITK